MLGRALLRDRSIQAVCDHLHLVLPDHPGKTAIRSAGLVQARDRPGIASLKSLFDAVDTRHGREEVDAHRWRGLAMLGTVGTTIRVPDSDENPAHFTLPSSGAHCERAYPQARVVGLMALGAHFLLDLKAGANTERDSSLSSSFNEQLPDHGVPMVDRVDSTPDGLTAITSSAKRGTGLSGLKATSCGRCWNSWARMR